MLYVNRPKIFGFVKTKGFGYFFFYGAFRNPHRKDGQPVYKGKRRARHDLHGFDIVGSFFAYESGNLRKSVVYGKLHKTYMGDYFTAFRTILGYVGKAARVVGDFEMIAERRLHFFILYRNNVKQ